MGVSPMVRHYDLLREIMAWMVSVFNRKPSQRIRLFEGFVPRLFMYSFWMLMGGYATITFSWWGMDILHCINKYNAELPMKPEYMNICASYLYVNEEDSVMYGRKYLLFYKWIHYVLLINSLMFYIPHKLSKLCENPKLCRLLYHLSLAKDERKDDVAYNDACDYYNKNSGSHNCLFIKYLLVNLIALAINVLSFFIIDFVFMGNFKDLGYATFPFERDIVNFKDELSLRFPPFAECELTEFHQLTNERTEQYGCHLLYMELFEKYFIILWLWMIFTTVASVLYICYISLFFISSLCPNLLGYAKPVYAKQEEIDSINKSLTKIAFGDFFILISMKTYFAPDVFYKVLKTLFYKPKETRPGSQVEIVINRQYPPQARIEEAKF